MEWELLYMCNIIGVIIILLIFIYHLIGASEDVKPVGKAEKAGEKKPLAKDVAT